MEGDYRRAIKDINASGRAAMARAARITCRMGTRQALDLSFPGTLMTSLTWCLQGGHSSCNTSAAEVL